MPQVRLDEGEAGASEHPVQARPLGVSRVEVREEAIDPDHLVTVVEEA